MSKLLAVLMSASLMLACVSANAQDAMTQNKPAPNPFMDKDAQKTATSDSMAMEGKKSNPAKMKKAHHKNKMKKHHHKAKHAKAASNMQ